MTGDDIKVQFRLMFKRSDITSQEEAECEQLVNESIAVANETEEIKRLRQFLTDNEKQYRGYTTS